MLMFPYNFIRDHQNLLFKGIDPLLKLFFYLWTDFAEIRCTYVKSKKKTILFMYFFRFRPWFLRKLAIYNLFGRFSIKFKRIEVTNHSC